MLSLARIKNDVSFNKASNEHTEQNALMWNSAHANTALDSKSSDRARTEEGDAQAQVWESGLLKASHMASGNNGCLFLTRARPFSFVQIRYTCDRPNPNLRFAGSQCRITCGTEGAVFKLAGESGEKFVLKIAVGDLQVFLFGPEGVCLAFSFCSKLCQIIGMTRIAQTEIKACELMGITNQARSPFSHTRFLCLFDPFCLILRAP